MNSPVNSRAASGAAGYPLTSKERMQKLDLLNHLIENLANPIIVCGPDGIGKTRLLKIFKEGQEKTAKLAWLDGDSKTRLESLYEALAEAIGQNWPDLKAQPLAIALERINSRKGKLILIIDNAGFLPPEISGQIIEYANTHPALRLVLALTHNELYIKSGTDPVIEDCYQIELPPLSMQQCEDYLEYLSTLPSPRIDFNAINESRVAEIFRETHGIPGKILAFLPKPVKRQAVDYSKPILISAVAALVLLVLGVQWWSSRPPQSGAGQGSPEKIEEASAVQAQTTVGKTSAIEKNQAQASLSETASLEVTANQAASNPPATPADTVAGPVPTGQNPAPVASQQAAASPPGSAPANNAAEASVQVNPAPPAPVNPELTADIGESGQWLASQPAENLSFQLMAMPKEQDILSVIERHPELKSDLRYIKTKNRRGYDRFILFYGSFPDPEQARTQKQNLPRELQQVWLRKIADFQKELTPASKPAQTQ